MSNPTQDALESASLVIALFLAMGVAVASTSVLNGSAQPDSVATTDHPAQGFSPLPLACGLPSV